MIAAARRERLRRILNALQRMRRIRIEMDLGPDPVLDEALADARAQLRALSGELTAA